MVGRDPYSSGIAEVLRRIRHRHYMTAGMALVISLVLHLLLVLEFPDVTWHFLFRPVLPQRHQPFEVRKVEFPPHSQAPSAADRTAAIRPENPAVEADESGDASRAVEGIDETALQPPAGGSMGGTEQAAAFPAPAPRREGWDPRQEILKINNPQVEAARNSLPRQMIDQVTRIPQAFDLTYAANRSDAMHLSPSTSSGLTGGEFDPTKIDLQRIGLRRRGTSGGPVIPPKVVPPVLPVKETARVIEEEKEKVAPRKRLEALLQVTVSKVVSSRDPWGYCQIEIRRRSAQVLPVLSKDILLVQDCSASITEKRLYFCRKGLERSLMLIGPNDRFNILAFRDKVWRCFPSWTVPTAEAVEKASNFVARLTSQGETDIYGFLQTLNKETSQTPGRPVIALMISDGHPTVGLTDSAQIIARFSQANRGNVSVFTMGTIGNANSYMLDLLSYRNRGDTRIVTTGRWDIPDVLLARMQSISRPVLMDTRFSFSGAARTEFYPNMSQNLYLDRPLILTGRFPRDLKRFVFRAEGLAGDTECDMIFNIDLDRVPQSEADIRSLWAWQKIYDLIGLHSATRSPDVLRELRRIEKEYGLLVPYARDIEQSTR